MIEYEYRQLAFARGTPKGEIRRALTDQAEYGRWELDRTVIYRGGLVRTRLRRKIIRAAPSTVQVSWTQ
ncbi:MAG: hypothetical protein IPL94_06940 [Tetrasphaera sp.]|nr:hypothetical protein [Tetrasphaera sp.]